jgi:cytochrome c oxidase subunit 3
MGMVTTVTSTRTERATRTEIGIGSIPPPGNGSNGNGSRGRGGDGNDDRARYSPKKARIAIRVALASILMMFTSLVCVYIVMSWSEHWQPVRMPPFLWLSTGFIICSSLTFNKARNSLKQGSDQGYSRWLLVTVALGLAFLASQLLAWRQLVAQGVYLATNPHSSFFYVLTGAHGVHLLGGILALDYLLLRTRRRQYGAEAEMKRQTAADVVSLYWHFMDGLWVFLFLLLFLWK